MPNEQLIMVLFSSRFSCLMTGNFRGMVCGVVTDWSRAVRRIFGYDEKRQNRFVVLEPDSFVMAVEAQSQL